MASSYPGALDSFTNPSSTDAMDASAALYHDVQHAGVNDAIEAVQAELGTDPAGALVTVGARVQTAQMLTGYRDSRDTFVGPDFFTLSYIAASIAMSSGYAYYSRWLCPESFTATKLWWVQTSSASTVTLAEIGIYAANGTRLQKATITTPVQAQGLNSVTITSQAVTAGTVYFLGFFINASTPGNVGCTSLNSVGCAAMGGSSSDRPSYSQSGQSDLPASVTFSGLTAHTAAYGLGISAS